MRTAKRQQRWDLDRRQARFAWVLLLPSALMILLFIAYPIVYSFLLTFSRFDLREVRWFAAGLSNYRNLLGDPTFLVALRFTLLYTIVWVVLSMAFALLVGVLLQQVRIWSAFFRSMLFLPTVVPVTMGFLMFQWILDPSNGILNYILREVGLPSLALNWLSNKDTVFGSMVGVTLWGFGPWILLLAGLLGIPKDFYEASKVDGASLLQEFWHITLPLLRPTLMVVTTLQVITALKIFVPIYVLTTGGPANASMSLYFLVFQKINQYQLAYATTVGWVFTFIVAAIAIGTAVAFRVRRDEA
ncbi:MAG: sugar ABC transporter permease [candidate division NC10 bacterium]